MDPTSESMHAWQWQCRGCASADMIENYDGIRIASNQWDRRIGSKKLSMLGSFSPLIYGKNPRTVGGLEPQKSMFLNVTPTAFAMAIIETPAERHLAASNDSFGFRPFHQFFRCRIGRYLFIVTLGAMISSGQ